MTKIKFQKYVTKPVKNVLDCQMFLTCDNKHVTVGHMFLN